MDQQTPGPAKHPDSDLKTDSDSEIDKEELKSVKDVLAQLTKTTKTLKIYLPNNPIYQKFLQELEMRLNAHLQEYEAMKLKIRQYALHYQGQVVYENTNRLESLAFKLYVDGIRELTFQEGIEKEEITSLLEILGREHDPSNPDDDMVTLLWERHFTHIRYLVADDFIETGVPVKPETAAVYGEVIQKEAAQAGTSIASAQTTLQEYLGPQMADKATQILVLSENEIESVKHQMQVEENAKPISTLMNILAAILRIEKEEAAFLETVDIFENVLETLMLRGDFWHSKKILELFRELMDPVKNLPESQRHRLNQAIDKTGDLQRIRELEPVLNQWGAIETDQLFDFWMLLNKNALLSLTELLGRLTQMKMRRIICEVLIQLAKNDIKPLVEKLDDPRWFVVRNVIYVLGKIGDERVIAELERVAHHKEVKVRNELVHALSGMKSPKACELLKGFLYDPESSLRILAIRSLVSQNYQEALEPIEDMIEDPKFSGKDLDEKKEIFEALGKLGGDRIVPKIRKLLKRSGSAWFKKVQNEELGLCAVFALKRIGTADAVAALRDGQKLSNKSVREACQKAHAAMEKNNAQRS